MQSWWWKKIELRVAGEVAGLLSRGPRMTIDAELAGSGSLVQQRRK
jgi:hypothetical protein